MTFSIRTFLIVIAILACWLGALVSKSPLLIELATNATALLILLTLAWAIWDSRPGQRAFWTGFFVLGFGNLVLAHYLNTYQLAGNQVAQLILGAPTAQAYPTVTYYAPPALPQPAGYAPTPSFNPQTYTVPYPVDPQYYTQHESIRAAVPALFSLLVGGIGGWLTLWISRRGNGATPC